MIDYKDITIFSFKNGYMEQELVKLSCSNLTIFPYNFKNYEDKFTNEALLDKFNTIKPTILTFGKDVWVKLDLLKKLKEISPKTKFIMFYGDQRGGVSPIVRPRIGLLDALLINNRDYKQHTAYYSAGIPYVNAYYDGFWEKEFFPIEQEREFDLFFGGNNFSPKKFPLSRFRFNLISAFKNNFNTVIYGQGWPYVFNSRKVVRKYFYNQVLQTAKINIGVNHYNIDEYYEERIIDCMASGRMHLTYYIPKMENMFKNHYHLVWFSSINEGIELARYYLQNDKEREEIAKNGRELMLNIFTHEKRTLWFLKVIDHVLNNVTYPKLR